VGGSADGPTLRCELRSAFLDPILLGERAPAGPPARAESPDSASLLKLTKQGKHIVSIRFGLGGKRRRRLELAAGQQRQKGVGRKACLRPAGHLTYPPVPTGCSRAATSRRCALGMDASLGARSGNRAGGIRTLARERGTGGSQGCDLLLKSQEPGID
jgi:hypothetical protein